MKQALLAVSFGTSYPDALAGGIVPVERALAEALPGRVVFRAFTSGMILRKLARQGQPPTDDVPTALERLAAEGYDDILVQPTHIINGEELEKLVKQAGRYQDRFTRLRLGTPLLTSFQDYFALADCLQSEIPAPCPDEAVLLMGHGTDHYVNAAYTQLEYVLHDRGWGRAFVATVEGYPGLNEALRRLEEQSVLRVRIYPLMLVAGDHAKHDMAGPGPESWQSRLTAAGYQVTCYLNGLGEYRGVQALFAQHAQAAEESEGKV